MTTRHTHLSFGRTLAFTSIVLLALAGCDRRGQSTETPPASTTPPTTTTPSPTPMPDTAPTPMPPASGASR